MHEFLRICEYLGVTPQEFFTGAGDETDRINIFNRLQDLDDGDIQKLQTFLGWIRIQNLTKKVAVAIQCGGHFLF